MSTSELRVVGRRIEARWWGCSHAGQPIVLLHEGLGSVAQWRDFPAALAERTTRPVFAYSRFGHGRSDPPPAPHTVDFMHEEAALLPEVLDAAGISEAVLFGHSDGGSIAMIAASRLGPRVSALILQAPHVFVEDVSIASIEATTAEYCSGELAARLAKYHDHVDIAFSGWSDVWLDPVFRTWNLEALLPAIHCPALLIQGTDDEYGTLGQIDAIARQVRGPVEQLVLEGCGHWPHRDRTADVLGAVARFLSASG